MSATTITRTVLVADDEPLTLRAIQSCLVDRGFTVHTAPDGTAGRAMVDLFQEECPLLLITDFDMPGCCGEELAEYARAHCADIKLLFTSGEPHPALVKAIAKDANARFINKPFMRQDLLAVLQDLGVV